jgi:hypothetical protein
LASKVLNAVAGVALTHDTAVAADSAIPVYRKGSGNWRSMLEGERLGEDV